MSVGYFLDGKPIIFLSEPDEERLRAEYTEVRRMTDDEVQKYLKEQEGATL